MTVLDFGSLVLGAGGFGDTLDREQSFAILDAFIEAGGQAIDTADAYSVWVPGHTGGESESILGDWLASRGTRNRVTIATKVGNKPDRAGLSRENITRAIDESLVRLRTDRVDLYYAHRDDPDQPQEEVLSAFDELVRAGKVREIGASNFTADRLRSAAAIAAREGFTPYAVAQDHYNLVEREPELALLPTIAELGIVEVPWGGLAHGFLAGAYGQGDAVPPPWTGLVAMYWADARKADLLDLLKDLAAAHRVSPAAIALAWLAAQPAVAAPVSAALSVQQLTELLQAASVQLTTGELAQLSEACAPIPKTS
ncbi:aldo/keto reductase [Paraburkholderia sp. J67]|uniref:aldo/keto reductase n=1 Tax=Paraburkholderia sp. J67 TaxID=2805435 RepID=UPI002ABDD966|nr:aldo/keto reductase [Paraburkholderia sp. J67]